MASCYKECSEDGDGGAATGGSDGGRRCCKRRRGCCDGAQRGGYRRYDNVLPTATPCCDGSGHRCCKRRLYDEKPRADASDVLTTAATEDTSDAFTTDAPGGNLL